MPGSKCWILQLPTETIWDICIWLIPHVAPEDYRIFQDQRDAAASLAGLANLGRTCRCLHAIVSRFRLERCPIKSVPPFRLEIIPYTLGILRDRQLACREVSIQYNPRDDIFGRVEDVHDFQLLYNTLAKLGLEEWCISGIPRHLHRHLNAREWQVVGPLAQQVINNMRRLPSAAVPLGLVLANLPNLTSITVSCAHFTGAVGYMGSLKIKFRSVRHLELRSPDRLGRIDSSFGLSRFTSLLRALPNLESLITYNCCGNSEVALPNLRELALDNPNFSAAALSKMLRTCYRLESFRITSSWPDNQLQVQYSVDHWRGTRAYDVQVHDIVSALQPVRHTLQCLTICNYRSTEAAQTDLRQFTSLHSLCISQETLYSAFVEPAHECRLRNILPTSLKKLVLRKFDATFVPMLRELARDLMFSAFPSLEEILVDPSMFLKTRFELRSADPEEATTSYQKLYQKVYRTNEEVLKALYIYRDELKQTFASFCVALEITL